MKSVYIHQKIIVILKSMPGLAGLQWLDFARFLNHYFQLNNPRVQEDCNIGGQSKLKLIGGQIKLGRNLKRKYGK